MEEAEVEEQHIEESPWNIYESKVEIVEISEVEEEIDQWFQISFQDQGQCQ